MSERSIGMVGLIVVAVVMMAGTFALLITGRPVPEPVWVAWGVIITALFGHGAFLAQSMAHQRVISDILDAVSVGAGAATTNGKPATGPPTGK